MQHIDKDGDPTPPFPSNTRLISSQHTSTRENGIHPSPSPSPIPSSLSNPPTMTTTLTFGPPTQQWHYSPSTKTYDLSGISPKKLTIPATEGPSGTSFTIAPPSTALVIVDMQNFFLDAGCMAHPRGLEAVEPTIRVIEKCREVGIQVSN